MTRTYRISPHQKLTWAAIKHAHGGRCVYCGEVPAAFQLLTKDHIIPRSKGGADNYSNFLPACGPCNNRRGHEMIPSFMRRMVREGGSILKFARRWHDAIFKMKGVGFNVVAQAQLAVQAFALIEQEERDVPVRDGLRSMRVNLKTMVEFLKEIEG